MTSAIVAMIWYFTQYLTKQEIELVSKVVSNLVLISVIAIFIIGALRKKVNVYDAFIEGAKGGIQTSITVIPYLVRYCVKYQIMATMAAVMPPSQLSTTLLSRLMRCLIDTVMMPTTVAT